MKRGVAAACAVLVLILLPWAPSPVAASQATDPEQELIERYAPILMLVPQEHPCDEHGEPYDAGPTSIVLGDPTIVLRQDVPGQPIVVVGPTEKDLKGLDESYYLDLQGNPLNPGCTYERASRERMAGQSPTTLVNIAREEGRDGFAIQYWFYYYFNDFNNTHESDWEMIQVVFDVNTIEEALQTDPIEVGYAQHGGGEWAAWDDTKLERDGTRPVVFASRGSHASQFDRAVYLMWGENNTGFGCDITVGADKAVPLKPVLVDGGSKPDSTAAWLSYNGRWGQKEAWQFSGPFTPNERDKWTQPLTWQESLRPESFAVPLGGALGPAPTDAFCNVAEASGYLARLATENLWQTVIVVLVGIAIVVALLAISWRVLADAAKLYFRHLVVFVPAGLAVLAVGLITAGTRWLGTWIYDASPASDTPAVWSVFATVGSLLQPLASLVLVAPMTIFATRELLTGRRPTPEQLLEKEREELGKVVRALIRPVIVIALIGLIPFIGIFIAAYMTVQRTFIPHAVVLNGDPPRASWGRSKRFVTGRWWRTAVLTGTLGTLVTIPSPVIGILLLILAARSVEFTNIASSIVYALVVPFAYVATTMYYISRTSADVSRENDTAAPFV